MKADVFSAFPLGQVDDADPLWSQFRSELPIEIVVLGRHVTIRSLGGNELEALIAETISEKEVLSELHHWEGRKGIRFTRGGEPLGMFDSRVNVREAFLAGDFLHFYMRQPICPRILLSDNGTKFRKLPGRRTVLNEAFLTWYALTYYERTGDGQLKIAVPCCGYRARMEKCYQNPDDVAFCLCSSNVVDPSGLCPSHRSASAKTLFNFYPLFDNERKRKQPK